MFFETLIGKLTTADLSLKLCSHQRLCWRAFWRIRFFRYFTLSYKARDKNTGQQFRIILQDAQCGSIEAEGEDCETG